MTSSKFNTALSDGGYSTNTMITLAFRALWEHGLTEVEKASEDEMDGEVKIKGQDLLHNEKWKC